jgi:hypothetical protein
VRTYGETKNCAGCRFWSEMIAQCHGGGSVQALCLADGGPMSGKYTTSRVTCTAWKSGHFGAVDDPPNYGEETRAMYTGEDASPSGQEVPK